MARIRGATNHVKGWEAQRDAERATAKATLAVGDAESILRLRDALEVEKKALNAIDAAIEAEAKAAYEAAKKRAEAAAADDRESRRLAYMARRDDVGEAQQRAIATGIAPHHVVSYNPDLKVMEAHRFREGEQREVSKGRNAVCTCGLYWSLVGHSNQEGTDEVRRSHHAELLERTVQEFYWNHGEGKAIRAKNRADALTADQEA